MSPLRSRPSAALAAARLDRAGGLAGQRLLDAGQSHCLRAGAGDGDAGAGDVAATLGDDGRDADDGVAGGRVRELDVGAAGAGRQRGQRDLGQHLARLQRRRQDVDEEAAGLDRPPAARADGGEGRRRRRASPPAGPTAGSAWATAPPTVPRLRTWISPTLAAASTQRGVRGAQAIRLDQLAVGRQRADGRAAVELDAGQARHAADVDQRRRLQQAQLHQRQQAMAAGDQLGALVLAQELERLVDRSAL